MSEGVVAGFKVGVERDNEGQPEKARWNVTGPNAASLKAHCDVIGVETKRLQMGGGFSVELAAIQHAQTSETNRALATQLNEQLNIAARGR